MNIVTKVNQVESYIDSQGTHQVVKGKLVLVKTDKIPTKIGQLIIFHTEQYSISRYKKGAVINM